MYGVRKTLKELSREVKDLVRENRLLAEQNDALKELVRGYEYCAIDDADAKDCPLYDESEPYRCKRDRMLGELGVSVDG